MCNAEMWTNNSEHAYYCLRNYLLNNNIEFNDNTSLEEMRNLYIQNETTFKPK